ncbi:M48 family metallopeptidase [Pseudoalteromonas luteoviolacea]|uniref:M48 family metallopeptidase n=1 Tax=Pseudoalteromonas luteoviolacea TaxID=43657 RepID=UPI001B3644B4|nr:YgjP-like metallopeptidase domain-containing protein [Pseudoalteromonas luteoviolacea]MBQ4814568.1 M48 family metallopeptidase [Pseudoalteromonas luteoviolacea]
MEFNYQLKLSKRRKTVAIKVRSSGVSVYAPHNICKSWLSGWVSSKQEWVLEKQKSLNEQQPDTLWSVNKILVFGHEYGLVNGASKSEIDHDSRKVYLVSDWQEDKQAAIFEVKQLFKKGLSEYLHSALPQYKDLMKSEYKSLKIRFYKRRWGSLSSAGVIAFNCALLGAPKWVINYVIVHELAHYHVMAHNTAFWTIVSRFDQNHVEAKKYLKEYGRTITDW